MHNLFVSSSKITQCKSAVHFDSRAPEAIMMGNCDPIPPTSENLQWLAMSPALSPHLWLHPGLCSGHDKTLVLFQLVSESKQAMCTFIKPGKQRSGQSI
ncbi:hypothetical protein VULLAG_LOCUS15486 [Vulpes lagopus]